MLQRVSMAVCLILTAIFFFGIAGVIFVHAGDAHHHGEDGEPVQLVEHCDSHMLSLPSVVPGEASPQARAEEFSPSNDSLKSPLFVADIFNPPRA